MSGRRAILRFKLLPGASKEDVRKAYLTQAKLLHPDVAGKKTTAAKAVEEFKNLQEDYEAGLNLVTQAAWQKGGSPGRAAYHEARQHRPPCTGTTPDDFRAPYKPPGQPGEQSQKQTPLVPLMTAAHRLRIAIIGGVGVFGAAVYFFQPSIYASLPQSGQYVSMLAPGTSHEGSPDIALSGQGKWSVSPSRAPKRQRPWESDEEDQRLLMAAFTEGRVVRRTDSRADG